MHFGSQCVSRPISIRQRWCCLQCKYRETLERVLGGSAAHTFYSAPGDSSAADSYNRGINSGLSSSTNPVSTDLFALPRSNQFSLSFTGVSRSSWSWGDCLWAAGLRYHRGFNQSACTALCLSAGVYTIPFRGPTLSPTYFSGLAHSKKCQGRSILSPRVLIDHSFALCLVFSFLFSKYSFLSTTILMLLFFLTRIAISLDYHVHMFYLSIFLRRAMYPFPLCLWRWLGNNPFFKVVLRNILLFCVNITLLSLILPNLFAFFFRAC